MIREVVLSPEAASDLDRIYDYIAEASGAERAYRYVTRIIDYYERFGQFPERGQRRDDLREGLRVIGFERRVTIAFHVPPGSVVIDRILYAGRDLPAIFGSDRS